VLGTVAIAFAVGVGAGHSFWSKLLHRGFVVGFCGGLTTFSSFVLEAVKESKTSYYDMLENIVLCTCSVFGAYYFGWHMALVAYWFGADSFSSGRTVSRFGFFCMGFVILACLLLALVAVHALLVGDTAQRTFLAAAFGGGCGSMLRFLFAKQLNRPGRYFCVGTFCANMSALLILCIVKTSGDAYWGQVLGSGFSGGLSTLSSLCNDFMVAAFASQEKASPVQPLLTAYAYITSTLVAGVFIVGAFLYI